jgi:diaminopimelate epimerase
MRIPFVKMHGLGNDFVVLDARRAPLPTLERHTRAALADRHGGIGCDQLIVLENSERADLRMRIFNPDGTEVDACGNATRAVGLLEGAPLQIETAGGVVTTRPDGAGVTVDMGVPRFAWNAIPLAYPMDTDAMPVGWDDLAAPAAVNVGNPHVVFFVVDASAVPLAEVGPLIEHDRLFPAGVNVNVAQVTSGSAIRLRVWERGAGLTQACGTGACATAVAALRRKLVSSPVTVSLPGGELTIAWDGSGSVMMTGPASESFRGSFALEDYA